MTVPRAIPQKIQVLLNDWDRYFRSWWRYHYIFGVLGTVSSITVASNPKFLSGVPYLLELLAWLAAVCIALITFLMPSRRAKAYVSAWRVLHDACTRYETDSTYQLQQLLDAAKRGEELISQSDPS